MRLRELPLLADENIDPGVVAHLRQSGWDVRSVSEIGMIGGSDVDVLRVAHASGRTVLTHDSDFGMLAIAGGQSCRGIVYLRPGHVAASFVIEMLDVVIEHDLDLAQPFVLVVSRKAEEVTIRLKRI